MTAASIMTTPKIKLTFSGISNGKPVSTGKRKRSDPASNDRSSSPDDKVGDLKHSILEASSDLSSLPSDQSRSPSPEASHPPKRRTVDRTKQLHAFEDELRNTDEPDDNDDDWKPDAMDMEKAPTPGRSPSLSPAESAHSGSSKTKAKSKPKKAKNEPKLTNGAKTNGSKKDHSKSQKEPKKAQPLEVKFQDHSATAAKTAQDPSKAVPTALQNKSAAWQKFNSKPSGLTDAKSKFLGKRIPSVNAINAATNMDEHREKILAQRKAEEASRQSRLKWEADLLKQKEDAARRKKEQEEALLRRQQQRQAEMAVIRLQDKQRRDAKLQACACVDILAQSRIMYDFERSLRHEPHPFSVRRPDSNTMLQLREQMQSDFA